MNETREGYNVTFRFGAKTMEFADRLNPGQTIVIDTHIFPKGEKGSRIYDEDAIVFTSEPLTVIDVNEKTLKVKDKQGQVIYIPLEDYTTHDGQVHQHLRSPVKELDLYIWVHYANLGESIAASYNEAVKESARYNEGDEAEAGQ